jgi:uncharacterized damage-inducible protein DinB
MLPAARALLAEIETEMPATRRVLERVPGDRLGWRPHEKSFSAGQLAQHIATIPGTVARLAQREGLDVASREAIYPECESAEALMVTLEASLATAREFLAGLDEETAAAVWRITAGSRQIAAMPRLAVMRSLGLNHWYHHRGEMVVYLRLLGVPVPIVYGRSADESPVGTLAG